MQSALNNNTKSQIINKRLRSFTIGSPSSPSIEFDIETKKVKKRGKTEMNNNNSDESQLLSSLMADAVKSAD